MFYGGLTYSSTSLGTLPLPAEHRYILDQTPLSYVQPPPGSLDLTRPENQQYVLEQAALLLNQPVDALLDLNNQQYPYPAGEQHPDPGSQRHFHKRPRLNTTTQMPLPYPDDLSAQSSREKTPLGGQPDPGMDADRKPNGLFPEGGLSGWTGSRLADCFASITMCPPFEPQPGMLLIFPYLPAG